MMKTANELSGELIHTKSELEVNKDAIKDIKARMRERDRMNAEDEKELVRTESRIEKLKEKLPKLKEQLAKAKKREKAEGKKAPKPAPAPTNSSDASEEE